MHDMRMLRDHVGLLRDGMRRRGILDTMDPVIQRAEALDAERRALIQAGDERKAARNSNAQEVARRKRTGEPAEELIATGRALGDEIARLETELREVDARLQRILLEIPNLSLPDVPEGGEEANAVVRTWGAPRTEGRIRPHWEIG